MENETVKMGRPRRSAGEITTAVRSEDDRPKRKERKNFGGFNLKLSARTRDGFHRCFMNDDGNVDEALDSGYTFVKKEGFEDQPGTDLGTNDRRLVGKKEDGSPLYAYLMEIEQEFFEEDQAKIQAVCDDRDNAIRQGAIKPVEGMYGRESIKYGTKR